MQGRMLMSYPGALWHRLFALRGGETATWMLAPMRQTLRVADASGYRGARDPVRHARVCSGLALAAPLPARREPSPRG